MSYATIKTLSALVVCALAYAQPSSAQTFPTRPIKIITPFAAGQGPDILARLVADKMSQELGKAVIVENKPGASGFIAFQAAKGSPADGYTIVQMDSFHIGTQPSLFKKLPYDAFKDFDPVTPLVKNYFFVVVPSTSKFKTMGDLVTAAREKPGAVAYGSWAVASPAHLGGLLLESRTGSQMTHVPYKETPMLYQSVANAEVDWAIGSAASTSALQQAGKLRYLAAAAPKRIAGYDNVPTVAEAGGPADFEVGGWNGFLVPHGTPSEIVTMLNTAVRNAMKSPDIASRLPQFTYEAYTMSPAQMGDLMLTEPRKWNALITAANIKLD